jgi:hypothetical protein
MEKEELDKTIMLGIKKSLISTIKDKLGHLSSIYYMEDKHKSTTEHSIVEYMLSSAKYLEEIIDNE